MMKRSVLDNYMLYSHIKLKWFYLENLNIFCGIACNAADFCIDNWRQAGAWMMSLV